MHDRIRRLLDLVLAVNAVGFGAIGLIALATPRNFAALVDIELTTAAARADFSGVYAGLHLAFAAVMVASLVADRTRDGLFVATCALTGLAVTRTWSMAVTVSVDELSLWLLALEVVALVVTSGAWRIAVAHGWSGRISRPTSRSPAES